MNTNKLPVYTAYNFENTYMKQKALKLEYSTWLAMIFSLDKSTLVSQSQS